MDMLRIFIEEFAKVFTNMVTGVPDRRYSMISKYARSVGFEIIYDWTDGSGVSTARFRKKDDVFDVMSTSEGKHRVSLNGKDMAAGVSHKDARMIIGSVR